MATTIISYLLSAALFIYLFKWYGVIGIVLFTLCAVASKQKKAETPVKEFIASLEAGIGIIIFAVIILMLLKTC